MELPHNHSPREVARMKLLRNAKSTPSSRLLLVRRVIYEGWSYPVAAEGAGVSKRTVAKWVRRFRESGIAGLEDASSRPAGGRPDAALGGHADPVDAGKARSAGVGDRPCAQDPATNVTARLRRLGLNRPPIAPALPISATNGSDPAT
jgi:hypothetical protein